MNSVVVTGIGLVSPLGTTGEHWSRLKEGKSGVDYISLFDASAFPCRIAGEIKEVPDLDFAGRGLDSTTLERRTIFGLVAAKLALIDGEIGEREAEKENMALINGAGITPLSLDDCVRWIDDDHFSMQKMAKALPRVASNSILRCSNDVVSGLIAKTYNMKGPVLTIVSACAAGTQAIGRAFRSIKNGYLDLALAGGTDSMISPAHLAGWILLNAPCLENDPPVNASKPFDAKRSGLVIGEGAGYVVLENLDHALERGAKNIYAEVIGYGETLDAYRLTEPHPEGKGLVKAINQALVEADLDSIDYINAHGTSTIQNDAVETAAIKQAFGRKAKVIPISSNKSMIGHLMAAAGAVEFISSIQCLNAGVIAPTINYQVPDSACDLDYVPNVARKKEIANFMSNSSGLGGQNASIIARRYS